MQRFLPNKFSYPLRQFGQVAFAQRRRQDWLNGGAGLLDHVDLKIHGGPSLKNLNIHGGHGHRPPPTISIPALVGRPCDVFINHRGVDTKRTVAGLLYDRLVHHNLHPFLDNKSMEPGDKLFESIGSAIRRCKVGIAVFSPRYCESYFCLLELARLIEAKKKVIPIFCDVKPSELQLLSHEKCTAEEIEKFREALEEAKYTVGLTFDSQNGNWPDLITSTTDMILRSINEEEEKY